MEMHFLGCFPYPSPALFVSDGTGSFQGADFVGGSVAGALTLGEEQMRKGHSPPGLCHCF